jgi:hypothetical protein
MDAQCMGEDGATRARPRLLENSPADIRIADIDNQKHAK